MPFKEVLRIGYLAGSLKGLGIGVQDFHQIGGPFLGGFISILITAGSCDWIPVIGQAGLVTTEARSSWNITGKLGTGTSSTPVSTTVPGPSSLSWSCTTPGTS